ncbi:hypothetical protein QML37_30555 [Klebsiella pneumoniae]
MKQQNKNLAIKHKKQKQNKSTKHTHTKVGKLRRRANQTNTLKSTNKKK